MYDVLSSGISKLCLSLTERTIAENIEIVEQERERVDLVEVRSDFLDPDELPHLTSLPKKIGIPAILSFRRRSDGGGRPVEESERRALLRRALAGGWTYVDLEHDLESGDIEERAAEVDTRVIRSLYDFKGVADGLESQARRLARTAREIPKLAVTPRSTGDLLKVLDAGERIRADRAIVVGMGEWGFPSRVLPERFSSVVTYATAGKLPGAPWEITPEVLRTVYRVGELGSNPTIYCVIGNPVLHSRSPWIHNPGLRALFLEAIYLPIQVDELSAFAELAERFPISGVSVTVPHKEAVRSLLSIEDGSVDGAGACNTLVREDAGWHGYNTDIAGFVGPLRDAAGDELPGRTALVVGAGGAARAVVAGLTDAGCRVAIVNRSAERAKALAKQFRCRSVDPSEVEKGAPYDIVVQATSVGMTPNEDADPLPGYRFTGDEIAYDLVYAPPRTRFLARAESAGCRTIGGREMLIRQAQAQFRLFTGRDYPVEKVDLDF